MTGQRDQNEVAGVGERVAVEVHDRDGVSWCIRVRPSGNRGEVVRAVSDAATNAWTSSGGEQFSHGEVNRGGGKVEGAADVVVIQVSSDDADDMLRGKSAAGELLNRGIGTSQTGSHRPEGLTETSDGVGDVLLSEADVDEDQAMIELKSKNVGHTLGNPHR